MNGGALELSGSIDMANGDLVDESVDSLVDRADRALYAAKRRGKNQWVLAPAPES